ncbi:hypothetical protein NSP_37120 [Nodularia spumigena CCY9414]|nr:hypothetical protein NSP_37120 [Nodularia spumigena CCY9414]
MIENRCQLLLPIIFNKFDGDDFGCQQDAGVNEHPFRNLRPWT